MKNNQLAIVQRFYEEAITKLKRVAGYEIKQANIDIFISSGKMHGYWRRDINTIGLNQRLFDYFEEGAVKFVLWHEIAHQVVTQVFKTDGSEPPHGAFFQKACDVLGIDSKPCQTDDFLNNYMSGKTSPIIKRIEKLMDTSGRSEQEAQAFLNKASEIMIKHNLSMKDIVGTERLFLKRQVGENYNRFPTYLFSLGYLMEEFYGVKFIKSHARFYVNGVMKTTFHMELYGDPDKLDVAEYIYDNILRKADELYEDHKNDPSRSIGHRKLSKKAFYTGLIKGFKEKLAASNEVVIEKMNEEKGEIVKLDDPILTEQYHKDYRVKYGNSYGFSGSGYDQGYQSGQSMTIRSGMKGNNSQLALT